MFIKETEVTLVGEAASDQGGVDLGWGTWLATHNAAAEGKSEGKDEELEDISSAVNQIQLEASSIGTIGSDVAGGAIPSGSLTFIIKARLR